MTLEKFFMVPFAATGDKSAVPDATQANGAVSFTQGYGPAYALEIGTDPNARPIERQGHNQILFEVTRALQEYQTRGVPDYITSAQNGGNAFPYSASSRVRFNDGSSTDIYESDIDNNTNLPTDTNSWKKIGTGAFATVGVLSDDQVPNRGEADTRYVKNSEFQDFSNIQILNSSEAWSRPSGVSTVHVICVGGGGGGASANTSDRGGGGGAGGFVEGYFDVSSLSSVPVVVGVGGGGGSGAASGGSSGGSSSFGSFCSATGGGGGGDFGGSPGTGSGTDSITSFGGYGSDATLGLAGGGSGDGGPSYFGGGGRSGSPSGADGNSHGSGGGGGGGAGSISGGDGANGIVIVRW